MKIEYVGKNYEIGTKLKNLLAKKIDKLDRYFGSNANARIVCSLQNKTYKLELTIINKGLLYRSEVIGENMYENIDIALPKIERQIIKQSQKNRMLFQQNAFDVDSFLFLKSKPKFKEELISKKKSFVLSPEKIEDAIMNIDAIGHDFYVFLNSDTGKVNVLYKRKDKQFGLIECEY